MSAGQQVEDIEPALPWKAWPMSANPGWKRAEPIRRVLLSPGYPITCVTHSRCQSMWSPRWTRPDSFHVKISVNYATYDLSKLVRTEKRQGGHIVKTMRVVPLDGLPSVNPSSVCWALQTTKVMKSSRSEWRCGGLRRKGCACVLCEWDFWGACGRLPYLALWLLFQFSLDILCLCFMKSLVKGTMTARQEIDINKKIDI